MSWGSVARDWFSDRGSFGGGARRRFESPGSTAHLFRRQGPELRILFRAPEIPWSLARNGKRWLDFSDCRWPHSKPQEKGARNYGRCRRPGSRLIRLCGGSGATGSNLRTLIRRKRSLCAALAKNLKQHKSLRTSGLDQHFVPSPARTAPWWDTPYPPRQELSP